MKTKLICLIIILLSLSCKSKKVTKDIQKERTTEEITVIKTVYDTIYKDRVITKTLPIYSETIIDTPCDELGQIRPINTTIGSGGNTSSINTLNGQLIIRQYIDSTKQQTELIKQLTVRNDSLVSVVDTLKDTIKTSETVVYVYPWWIYALMIGCVLFAGLWVYTKFIL